MAVTIEKPIRIGPRAALLKYSSDLGGAPTFYIYVDGILVAQTTATEFTLAVNPDETYVVEILDDADAEPMQRFPGKARLGWFFVEGVDYYRVDEYIGDAWVERIRMPDNDGYMKWESRFLEDGQIHLFRITPVGTDDNEGTAKEFSVLIVRRPDSPDVNFSHSTETQKLTITEN